MGLVESVVILTGFVASAITINDKWNVQSKIKARFDDLRDQMDAPYVSYAIFERFEQENNVVEFSDYLKKSGILDGTDGADVLVLEDPVEITDPELLEAQFIDELLIDLVVTQWVADETPSTEFEVIEDDAYIVEIKVQVSPVIHDDTQE